MHINAVNTLEIRIFEEVDRHFHSTLRRYVEQFDSALGCVGYTLSQPPNQNNLWILSGYWSSTAEMTEHFESDSMASLVNALIECRANLTFASFTPLLEALQRPGI